MSFISITSPPPPGAFSRRPLPSSSYPIENPPTTISSQTPHATPPEFFPLLHSFLIPGYKSVINPPFLN